MNKKTIMTAFVVSLALCSCSKTDPSAKKRVADREVNTRHIKGTTDVLKNYRLPDVRPATSPKQTLKRSDTNQNAKLKSEQRTK